MLYSHVSLDWRGGKLTFTGYGIKKRVSGTCPSDPEIPLAEEDAKQFIDVDVRPTKSTYSDEEIWQLLSALCGASNATQFQALPRPQQKLHLFAAHEEGIGPRTLSRLTGVPYSIVQRATSDTVRYGSMVCESLPCDEEFETHIDDSEYEKYPEY